MSVEIALTFPHVPGAIGYSIYCQEGGVGYLDHWIPPAGPPVLVAEIRVNPKTGEPDLVAQLGADVDVLEDAVADFCTAVEDVLLDRLTVGMNFAPKGTGTISITED